MKRLILLALLGLAVPAAAQSVAPSDTDTTADATSTSPSVQPQRNIMPLSINHKPNPVNPPAEIARSIDLFFTTLHNTSAPSGPDSYEKAYDTFLAGGALLGLLDRLVLPGS